MKKGISLVVLLISLLIMLILATAIIMSGSYTLKGVEKANAPQGRRCPVVHFFMGR